MSRIAETFARCAAENRAAFIPFIMAGDPSRATAQALLNALPEAGADIIELGIPFSDPMADGPTIEAAGLRALAGGMHLHGVLAMVRDFRATNATTPIVLMGYANPIYVYGFEAFARDAAEAGVDGVIVVDLPPEEAGELEPHLTKAGMALVRLVAPTSVPDRVATLATGAQGYLYYVSIAGITGAAAASPQAIAEKLAAIRSTTDLPVCVGFGVKTPADVAALAPLADGVVVGSAIVKQIEATKGDVSQVMGLVRVLAGATKRG